jgi:hypothetical protein
MLKVDQATIDRMERSYPGITEQIHHFDTAGLPACPHCNSSNTASVQIGLVQRAINIAAATTKFRLIPNESKPGPYFCNDCKRYFGNTRIEKT